MMISQSVQCHIVLLTNMSLKSLGHIRKTWQLLSCCVCTYVSQQQKHILHVNNVFRMMYPYEVYQTRFNWIYWSLSDF